MIAPFGPISHPELPRSLKRAPLVPTAKQARALPLEADRSIAHLVSERWLPTLLIIWGFTSYFPYPALSVGNSTALQIGNILSIVMLIPVLIMSRGRAPLAMFLLVEVPVWISTLKVAFIDNEHLELSLKVLPTWIVPLLTLMLTQLYAPKYSMQILIGTAFAVLVHVAVGALQMVAFQQGYFPLVWLYANPNFLSVPDHQDVIVKWIQRPFGLFPEPSAMASSIAPFILLWLGELCGVIRFKQPPTRWQRRLFAVTTFSGIGLIIVSQSGHSAITLAAAALFIATWLWRSKATMRTFATIIGVFGVAMPLVAWFAIEQLSNRMTGGAGHGSAAAMSNGSWDERSSSLIYGLQLVASGSIWNIFFGLGSGLSATMMHNAVGIDAIFSVTLTWLCETGLVGVGASIFIAHALFKAWRDSRFDKSFAIIFVVWIIGITLTTSYCTLEPIYIAFGWFLCWPVLIDTSPRVKQVVFRSKIAPAVSRQGTWLEGGV